MHMGVRVRRTERSILNTAHASVPNPWHQPGASSPVCVDSIPGEESQLLGSCSTYAVA
jgi:hypothetical protein